MRDLGGDRARRGRRGRRRGRGDPHAPFYFRIPEGMLHRYFEEVARAEILPVVVYNWHQDWYVWNNDGDRARLRKPNGTTVDSCSYSGAGSSVGCMGGTGLEPVTPSLSTRSIVRAGSPGFAHDAWLSGIGPVSERSSERERTSSVAIVATPSPSPRPTLVGPDPTASIRLDLWAVAGQSRGSDTRARTGRWHPSPFPDRGSRKDPEGNPVCVRRCLARL